MKSKQKESEPVSFSLSHLTPRELKEIPDEKIPALCAAIRSFLVDAVGRSGGHLASNLGITELTVAIHRVMDSPKDHILFDVGHQSYVHKILTGRGGDFCTLRTPGGLSGFTARKESPHDPFGAGHSSTSISAALGFAEADRLNGSGAYTVAVIGDGAFTGGMVHEAFNNLCPDHRLIVILNENRMSISKNRGSFASYLAKVRISKGYQRWKRSTKSILARVPLIGGPLYRLLSGAKDRIKRALFPGNYFEQIGFYYIGPVAGNNYENVVRALRDARRISRPVLIHVYTKKGKGYEPAEKAPESYHNIPPAGRTRSENSFHTVMARELIRHAERDADVLAITAAMGNGTGLSSFEAAFPDRFYDVGIAEEHALTFAAGLAASGKKPFVAIYSTFLQRAYDNILHDIALQDLPVRILIDRTGLAEQDGATHHGIFDVAFLSQIPGVRILTPATYADLARDLSFALAYPHPIAIRYPNAEEDARVAALFPAEEEGISPLRADFSLGQTPRRLIVTYGTFVSRALDAAALLRGRGMPCGVVLLGGLAPYGESAAKLLPYLSGAERILFAEEGIRAGGAGMLLLDRLLLSDPTLAYRARIAAVEDGFAAPDSPSDLYDYAGLSAERLAACLTDWDEA